MGKYLWCNIKWEYTRMYMNMHNYRQYNHVKVRHNHVKMTENLSISTGYLWDSETMDGSSSFFILLSCTFNFIFAAYIYYFYNIKYILLF